jgi:hypothetical protein
MRPSHFAHMFRPIPGLAAISVACLAVSSLLVDRPTAQTRLYNSTSIGNIASGHVPAGEHVELEGDLRWSGTELWLSVAYMSAMVPLIVETTALAADQLAAIQARCAGPQYNPACWAKILGEVVKKENNRHGLAPHELVAHQIELLDYPRRP